MRLIDADLLQTALMDEYVGIAGYNTRAQFYRAIEIVQQQPTITQPPNAPLPLEELREMDGEPVWITAKGIGRYDVYQGCANRCLEQFYKAALPSSGYGTDWLAYRRKLEGKDNEPNL